jgi:DNA-repair protein XRCC1
LKKELSEGEPATINNDTESLPTATTALTTKAKVDSSFKPSVFQKWKNMTAVTSPTSADKAGPEEARSSKHDDDATSLGANNLSPNKSKTYFKPRPDEIFKGVVFALSGFQNPLRSELRDKGMKLGAKYRPDWTDDCTHLM